MVLKNEKSTEYATLTLVPRTKNFSQGVFLDIEQLSEIKGIDSRVPRFFTLTFEICYRGPEENNK